MENMFALRGGVGGGWNYAHPDQEGYMPSITGTVVKIERLQTVNFMTRQPEFFDNGNPKISYRLTIKGQSGKELAWTFDRKSVGDNACINAIEKFYNKDKNADVYLSEILGKIVSISTQHGEYGSGRPRPWTVEILGDGNPGDLHDPAIVDHLKNAQPQQVQQPQQQVSPQIQYQQQRAAQALGYQQPQPQPQQYQQAPVQQQYVADPTGGYYDNDIPF